MFRLNETRVYSSIDCIMIGFFFIINLREILFEKVPNVAIKRTKF